MVTRHRRALRALTLIAALAASAAPAPSPWTILFRSDDPTLWNTTSGKPDDPNGFALPLSAAPDAIRYLRIKRMDTGDYIIFRGNFKSVPGTGASLAWIDGSVTWPAGSATGIYLGIVDRASISLEKNDAANLDQLTDAFVYEAPPSSPTSRSSAPTPSPTPPPSPAPTAMKKSPPPSPSTPASRTNSKNSPSTPTSRPFRKSLNR